MQFMNMQFTMSLAIAVFFSWLAAASAQSTIDVTNGDFHIDLAQEGAKVYVSVAGGQKIELFNLANRLAALEASAAADKVSTDKATEALLDSVDKLTQKVAQVEEKVDLNTDSASAVLLDQTERVFPTLEELQTASTAASTLLDQLNAQAAVNGEALSLVPKMSDCAAGGKIYHPETEDCQPPVAVHCDGLTTSTHSDLLVPGSVLADPALCSFNQHYGGQACAAVCMPGTGVYKADADGKKVGDGKFGKGESAAYTCSSAGEWQLNFGCTIPTCGSLPATPDGGTVTAVQGVGAKDNTAGATLQLSCDDDSFKTDGVDAITCDPESAAATTVEWTSPKFTAECVPPLDWKFTAQYLGCHEGGNSGYIGRPSQFLDAKTGVPGSCTCKSKNSQCNTDCIAWGKMACAALRTAGKECFGFAINTEQWGVQVYDTNAQNFAGCGGTANRAPFGWKAASRWDMWEVV